MAVSAFQLAQRFLGIHEVAGHAANPQILAMLRLDAVNVEDDEVPWCSAFVNYIHWLADLPRSRSLAARSWLAVGVPITLDEAEPGDVVVLKRGEGVQPGPEVLNASGHVGFFAGLSADGDFVEVLGGNQSNGVSMARFPVGRILSVRSVR